MEKFKTLKQLNAEFKKSLLDLEKMQNKIDKLYNHLKNDLKSLEIVIVEMKKDKTKFTKNGRKKVETIEEEETTRVVEIAEEINLNDFKNQIERMKEFSYNNVKSLEKEDDSFMEFDR
jgi:chloramphenicol O-acetyltransferase